MTTYISVARPASPEQRLALASRLTERRRTRSQGRSVTA